MKAKTKAYSQPLLSILLTSVSQQASFLSCLCGGRGRDSEVERDEESQFPKGKAGYDQSRVLYKIPLTKEVVKRALCLTLGKEVVLKISKNENMLEMNSVFKEALIQARCAHPNVCELLDFRLYVEKSGFYSAYIVMESLEKNLNMEIQERKLQPYDEVELIIILQQVAAALLNAKHQDFAHQNIKPYNIFRGPQGLKLTGFGATWFKGQSPETSTTIGAEIYISPEEFEEKESPKVQQHSFESDIFSLGMTILRLAMMELPERTLAMSRSKLQALLQRKVQALRFSEELKQLLAAMLRTGDRPPLEAVQMEAERIYRQAAQALAQKANRLRQQLELKIAEGKYAKVIELATAVHAIYSRLPEDKDTADNLFNWGNALGDVGRSAEAVEKYAAAHAIYSRLPEDKGTASNLYNWALVLRRMERSAEAVEKYAAAHAIYTRLPEDKNSANNLSNWGNALDNIDRSEEAVKKYAAAHAIYSRLPEDKSIAKNLYNWGNALRKMGWSARAVDKYAAAHAIYTRLPEDLCTASNLGNWGNALKRMGRSAEAVEKYAAAHAIYSRLLDDKSTADNLYNWGNALDIMRRSLEAAEKYEAARTIYVLRQLNSDVYRCGNSIWSAVASYPHRPRISLLKSARTSPG